MKPFRPPLIFGDDQEEVSAYEMQCNLKDLLPSSDQEDQLGQSSQQEQILSCQVGSLNEGQELLGSNSSGNRIRMEVRSSNDSSVIEAAKDSVEESQILQNVIVWTRLANGEIDIELPPAENLQLLDFQQFLIANKNVQKIVTQEWIYTALQRALFYQDCTSGLSEGQMADVKKAVSILQKMSSDFQYQNSKKVIEETIDVLFESMDTKSYQKLGEQIRQAASSLNLTSGESIGKIMQEILEKRFTMSCNNFSDSPKYKPDIQFLITHLDQLRTEFDDFKKGHLKDFYTELHGLSFIYESALQKLEVGASTEFCGERIELCLLRCMSMFFGFLRAHFLSKQICDSCFTWKDYQMKYLNFVRSHPDIAFLQQKSWQDSCRNLCFPWRKNYKYEPGSRNAQLKEIAKQRISREQLPEKISGVLGVPVNKV